MLITININGLYLCILYTFWERGKRLVWRDGAMVAQSRRVPFLLDVGSNPILVAMTS